MNSYDYLDENTLRNLLEIHRKTIDMLMAQAKVYGDVETMAPIHVQHQLAAARKEFTEISKRLSK